MQEHTFRSCWERMSPFPESRSRDRCIEFIEQQKRSQTGSVCCRQKRMLPIVLQKHHHVMRQSFLNSDFTVSSSYQFINRNCLHKHRFVCFHVHPDKREVVGLSYVIKTATHPLISNKVFIKNDLQRFVGQHQRTPVGVAELSVEELTFFVRQR